VRNTRRILKKNLGLAKYTSSLQLMSYLVLASIRAYIPTRTYVHTCMHTHKHIQKHAAELLVCAYQTTVTNWAA